MKTVMPSGATTEHLAAFLMVANRYGLNPITKEIHAFPAKSGGVQPVVGIDGWISLAQSHPEFDGMEFDYADDEKRSPYSVTCRIYRKDRTRPTEVTEFYSECNTGSGPWKSHPRRFLRHRAAIQGIRYAFGFSGIKDEEDIIYTDDGFSEPGFGTTAGSVNKKLTAKQAEAQAEKVQK